MLHLLNPQRRDQMHCLLLQHRQPLASLHFGHRRNVRRLVSLRHVPGHLQSTGEVLSLRQHMLNLHCIPCHLHILRELYGQTVVIINVRHRRNVCSLMPLGYGGGHLAYQVLSL